jgi:hypothetical protein
MSESTKKCFVISPIDKDGSDIRIRADWLLIEIVKPVLESAPYNFSVMRADEFPEPGMITTQIINAVLDWDLVIADLSGRNANAFYELALRHMIGKPVIHMIEMGETIPFDVFEYRAISYSIKHPSNIQKARSELRQAMDAILHEGYVVSNPVSKARGIQDLVKSSDPEQKIVADLVEKVDRLEIQLNTVITALNAQAYKGSLDSLSDSLGGVFGPLSKSPDQAFLDAAKNLSWDGDVNSADTLRRRAEALAKLEEKFRNKK